MKHINKFNSIEEALNSTAYSPNVSLILGSSNPDNVVYTDVGNGEEIVFVNDNGTVTGIKDGVTENEEDVILVTCDVVDRQGNIITIFSENSAADVSDDKGVVSREMELDLSHIEFTFENTSVLPTDNISLTIYWMYTGSEYNGTVQMSYDSENSKFYYDSGKQGATQDGPGMGVYPAVLTITNVTQNTVLREISFGHGEENVPIIPTKS